MKKITKIILALVFVIFFAILLIAITIYKKSAFNKQMVQRVGAIAELPRFATRGGASFGGVGPGCIHYGHFYIEPDAYLSEEGEPIPQTELLQHVFDRYQARLQRHLPHQSIPGRKGMTPLKGTASIHGKDFMTHNQWVLNSKDINLFFEVEWVDLAWVPGKRPDGVHPPEHVIRLKYRYRVNGLW